MDQTSNVQYRAEKVYKNSREKFWYLLREVVSNSIHSLIIKQPKAPATFVPEVSINVSMSESEIFIVVTDNGEGFTQVNSDYFSKLDERNPEKERLNLHPMGQGRLAVVFFADNATYSTTFRDESGKIKRKEFPYPQQTNLLFSLDNFNNEESKADDTGTVLRLHIHRQQTFLRAKTFFAKHDTAEKLKLWFVETFFPFFVNNDRLNMTIDFNGQIERISQATLTKTIEKLDFTVDLPNAEGDREDYSFNLWLVDSLSSPKSRNEIQCFARHLKANIEDSKLEYYIDIPKSYEWYLTSRYFDESVDQKGDKIEIAPAELSAISLAIKSRLDEHFKEQIVLNRKTTRKNLETVKEKYHSLAVFVDEKKVSDGSVVVTENDIVNMAVESKGSVEKKYWTSASIDQEDQERLLNSSLQVYIAHRSRVLAKLQGLVRKFDDDGSNKSELEDEVHDLLFRRGQSLKSSENINHLHNLWILDDRFTIFSDTMQARSTMNGQSKSDIYFWIDDPDRIREILILELKSTTSAHNAGSKEEGMVAQVKRYATNFYRDPVKVLDWHVDSESMLYNAIILARKSDVYKELNSNNVAGNPIKIPFLEASYYLNESFSVANANERPRQREIRIEIYSYEDISELAANRNNVFFKLLKNEFKVEDVAE